MTTSENFSTIAVIVLLLHVVFTHCLADEGRQLLKMEEAALLSKASGEIISRYQDQTYINPNYESGGSRISISCYNYLLCEYYTSVQLNNVAFHEGQLLTESRSPKNKLTMKQINHIYTTKEGHLPSTLATISDNTYDYVAGPKIADGSTLDVHSICDRKWRNESALFLFPWEIHNAYHSLNDNLLAVLSHLYIHRLFGTRAPETIPYQLYQFSQTGSRGPTTMYRILSFIFKTHSAGDLMKNGPHCIQSGIWGSAMKIFYRDSLFNFRSEVYDLLREVLVTRMPSLKQLSAKKTAIKVVIVSRGGSSGGRDGTRKLSRDSEQRLAKSFEALGASVTICSDFSRLNSVEKFIEEFWDVDICIGVHGAGLSNCIFGRPGMVIIEFQTYHNFGFDSFMKIAHMAKGQYMLYDVRAAPMTTTVGAGAQLAQTLVERIAITAMSLLRFSLDNLEVVRGRLHPSNLTQPDSTHLHSFTEPHPYDMGRVYTYRPPISVAQIKANLFTEELIIDYSSRIMYFNHPRSDTEEGENKVGQSKRDSHMLIKKFVAEYLKYGKGFAPDSTSSSPSMLSKASSSATHSPFTVRTPDHFGAVQHAHLTLVNLDNEKDVNIRFKGKNGGKKGIANFHHVDGGTVYSPPGHHQEVWIMFNPAIFPSFPQTTVLGPLMKDNYLHCIQLPYFKFRLMTQRWGEHRGECDRHLAQRKRSGANDQQLLTSLIK